MEITVLEDSFFSKHDCDRTDGYCSICLVEKRGNSDLAFERCVAEAIRVHGNVCYLCHEPIDFDAPRRLLDGNGLGLQLDHVLPLSKGGKDSIYNVRPTHAICNNLKRNKPLTALPTNYRKEE